MLRLSLRLGTTGRLALARAQAPLHTNLKRAAFASLAKFNSHERDSGMVRDTVGRQMKRDFASEASAGRVAGAEDRTLCLTKLPRGMTADAVRALIPVEAFQSISIKPNSRVAFVTFVDPAAASAFLQKTSSDGLTVDKQNVVVNRALERSPTRCVYVGDIQDFDALDRQRLRADFGEFGAISRVRVNKPNRCVFITFDSIPNATKALDTMRTRPDYANFRLEYAEDRLEDAQQRKVFIGGSKTVFLPLKEKLQADFSQFGEIEGIDVLTVKNVAFVTLTKAPDATKAIDEIKKRPEYAGLTVSLSADKWSPSTPASAIYVGEIADFTTFTADRLRADFSPFAEVTAVKVVKKKECAFVRFGSVSDATKAMNAIKTRPEYAEMIVHFANPA